MIFKAKDFKYQYDLARKIEYRCGTDREKNSIEHVIEGSEEELKQINLKTGQSIHGVLVRLEVKPKEEKPKEEKEKKPKKKVSKKKSK